MIYCEINEAQALGVCLTINKPLPPPQKVPQPQVYLLSVILNLFKEVLPNHIKISLTK